MTLTGIFFSRYSRMRSSLPVSLVTEECFPLGLPSRMPSLLLRAKASFVREEIIERSISAEREKAKARTLEEMLGSQEQRPENVRLGNTERPLAIHFVVKTVI